MATAGGNEFRAEFFPDVGDMDIQQVGKRRVVFVEKMLVKPGARNHFAAMQSQKFDQRILAGGQLHRLSLEQYGAGGGINDDFAEFDDIGGFVGAAADDGAQAGKNFFEIK